MTSAVTRRRTGTQLMIGSGETERFSREEIVAKLRRARELADIEFLLFWNASGTFWYDVITDACNDLGIDLYLWYPVMADTLGSEVLREHVVRSACGHSGYGTLGVWDGFSTAGEDFLFLCPNNEQGLDRVFDSYRRLLSEVDVKGVFLDRIRYPSPANGIEMLTGCMCRRCEALMEVAPGLSRADRIVELLQVVPSAPGFEEWAAVQGLSSLLDFRASSITRVIHRFASYARERELSVGLDLLSPRLAAMVGQRYDELAVTCDWIKSMTYCRALGPAGLPLEIASLWQGLLDLPWTIDPKEIRGLLQGWFDCTLPGTPEKLRSEGLPPEHFLSEMAHGEAVLSRSSEPGVDLYCGLEFVDHRLFSTTIGAQTRDRYLAALQSIRNGLIICWNVLYVPDASLAVIGDACRGNIR